MIQGTQKEGQSSIASNRYERRLAIVIKHVILAKLNKLFIDTLKPFDIVPRLVYICRESDVLYILYYNRHNVHLGPLEWQTSFLPL